MRYDLYYLPGIQGRGEFVRRALDAAPYARRLLVLLASILCACIAHAQTIPSYVFSSPLLPLIAQMPENSWLKVNANRFDSVWTPDDLEPLGWDGVTHPPARIIIAWSGFAWDSNRGDLIIYGGGHANYSGNDVYRWHASTLQWERASLPSEIKVDPVAGYIAIDGVDNAPIASHTYDNNVFLPLADRFLTYGGATYNPDGRTYARVDEANPTTWRRTGPYLFDPNRANGNEVGGTTGSQVQRVAPHPEIVGGQMWQNRDVPKWLAGNPMPGTGVNGCTAATIEGQHDVMYIAATNGLNGGKNLFRYQLTSLANPAADQIGLVGAFAVGTDGQTSCGFDATRKLFVRTGTNGAPFFFWDLTNPGPTNADQPIQIDATIAGFQAWLNAQGLDIQNCAIKFDPGRGTFLIWCGAPTLWELHEPAGGNSTGGWTIAMVTPAAGPPGDFGTGILGKWRYAPYFDVFVGLEDPEEGQIWIYKPVRWQRPNIAGNALPTVSIVSPANNATVVPGSTVNVSASAGDPDGTVVRVEYYVNGAKLGQATTPPYALAWTPLLKGSYRITAVAVDNDGGTGTSVTVTLNVNAPITTTVLQRGGSGNPNISDTYLYSLASTTPQGASDLLYLDGSTARPLLRFTIFQSEGGSVPDGAVIQSAQLSLYKQYYTSEVALSPVQKRWTEAGATWLATGAGGSWSAAGGSALGSDIAATPDDVLSGDFNPGWMTFDVTGRLRQWSANAAANNGWRLSLTTAGANPLQFHASEYAADPTLRPKLTVVYAPPVPRVVSTTTTLSTSPNPSTSGQAVTLKATVTTSSGVASGSVTFSDGGVAIGSAQLNTTGIATLVTSALAPGTHGLSARYGGDAQHQASTSATLTQTVQQTSSVTTVVLQDGIAGYSGVADTYLYSFAPNAAYGASELLYASAQQSVPLLRFAIFQSEGGKVPDGSVIQSATLALYKQYYPSEMRLHPLLVPWSEATATWNRRNASTAWTSPGASGAGNDYATTPDVVISGTYNPGWVTMDVTSRVRQWATNVASNKGWRLSLSAPGATPLRFHASEYAADPSQRPKLTVVYVTPSAP